MSRMCCGCYESEPLSRSELSGPGPDIDLNNESVSQKGGMKHEHTQIEEAEQRALGVPILVKDRNH